MATSKTPVKKDEAVVSLSHNDVSNILELGFDSVANSPETIDSAKAFAHPELVDDKDVLVGQSFVILYWNFYPGDYDNDFCAVVALTKANELIVFNEGGTGVSAQLRDYTERHGKQSGPILLRKGLTKSDYWRDPETNEVYKRKPEGIHTEPAKTYYLS